MKVNGHIQFSPNRLTANLAVINEYHSDIAIHKTLAGKPPSDLWIEQQRPPNPASRTGRLSACIHTNSVTNMNARNNDFWDTIWDIK